MRTIVKTLTVLLTASLVGLIAQPASAVTAPECGDEYVEYYIPPQGDQAGPNAGPGIIGVCDPSLSDRKEVYIEGSQPESAEGLRAPELDRPECYKPWWKFWAKKDCTKRDLYDHIVAAFDSGDGPIVTVALMAPHAIKNENAKENVKEALAAANQSCVRDLLLQMALKDANKKESRESVLDAMSFAEGIVQAESAQGWAQSQTEDWAVNNLLPALDVPDFYDVAKAAIDAGVGAKIATDSMYFKLCL